MNSQHRPQNIDTATQVDNGAMWVGSFIDAMIVSRHFWPTIHGRVFKMHPRAATYLSKFSSRYSVLKAPRELDWKLNLGVVELDVVFGGDQKRSFRVDPLHASLLLHFEDSGRWAFELLAEKTGLAKSELRKKMMLWVNFGVIQQESSNCAYVVPQRLSDLDGPRGKRGGVMMITSDGDEPDRAVSGEEQMVARMKVFEQYIMGMLTNLGALPLQRIHNMLKMFASGEYDKTTDELLHFLNELVDAGKLEHICGVYSIPPA